MGVFAEFQPQYAALGIPTVPVEFYAPKGKKPMAGGSDQFRLRNSYALTHRFPDATALGFDPSKSGLVLIDVDTPDENVVHDVLERHGDSPVITKSPSGGHHVYYRASPGSEARRYIRPNPNVPVDVIAAGLAVAAPSENPLRGSYSFVRGEISDIRQLPYVKNLQDFLGDAAEDMPSLRTRTLGSKPLVQFNGLVPEGQRNDALYRHCMAEARHVINMDDLIDIADHFNETCVMTPLEDDEVIRVVSNAWVRTQKGENWFGVGRIVGLQHSVVDTLAAKNPDAFAFLSILKMNHWGRPEFFLACKAMAPTMGWTLPRWRAARDALVEIGQIECVHQGGRGPNDPPRYRWAAKGRDIVPQ